MQTPDAIAYQGKYYRSEKGFLAGTHRSRTPADTFKLLKPYLAEAGVTRIADVTGLDHVGVPTTLALRPNAVTMACSSGKGPTLDHAYVSGAVEAIELHAAETVQLPSRRASYRDLAACAVVPDVSDLPLTRWSLFSPTWPIEWYFGWDLITQREVAIPLALIGMGRRFSLLPSAGFFQLSSNGLGGGNTLLEAISSALHEVIERDSVACRTYAARFGQVPIRVLPPEELQKMPEVAAILAKCDSAGVNVIVSDYTSDSEVPTYVAVAYDVQDSGIGVMQGYGSHLDPEIAVLRAVTEALQARLNLIAGSRDDIFRAAFFRAYAERDLAIQEFESEARRSPSALPRTSMASTSFEEDVAILLKCVEKAGAKHVIVADITPNGSPIHIVRVVVPGFEGYMHKRLMYR